jgi:hypothetical protein
VAPGEGRGWWARTAAPLAPPGIGPAASERAGLGSGAGTAADGPERFAAAAAVDDAGPVPVVGVNPTEGDERAGIAFAASVPDFDPVTTSDQLLSEFLPVSPLNSVMVRVQVPWTFLPSRG